MRTKPNFLSFKIIKFQLLSFNGIIDCTSLIVQVDKSVDCGAFALKYKQLYEVCALEIIAISVKVWPVITPWSFLTSFVHLIVNFTQITCIDWDHSLIEIWIYSVSAPSVFYPHLQTRCFYMARYYVRK